MAVTRMGYEGRLFVDAAGATATTQVTNIEDLNYDNPLERVETTTRGDGTSLPKKSEKPVTMGAEVTWSMFHKDGDATLTTILAAARAGSLLAIRTKSYASGTGFDGDCSIEVRHEKTLKGASKYNFTATPCDDLRAWTANS